MRNFKDVLYQVCCRGKNRLRVHLFFSIVFSIPFNVLAYHEGEMHPSVRQQGGGYHQGGFQRGDYQHDGYQHGSHQQGGYRQGSVQHDDYHQDHFQQGGFEPGNYQHQSMQHGSMQREASQNGSHQQEITRHGNYQHGENQHGADITHGAQHFQHGRDLRSVNSRVRNQAINTFSHQQYTMSPHAGIPHRGWNNPSWNHGNYHDWHNGAGPYWRGGYWGGVTWEGSYWGPGWFYGAALGTAVSFALFYPSWYYAPVYYPYAPVSYVIYDEPVEIQIPYTTPLVMHEMWVASSKGNVPDHAVVNNKVHGNPTYYCRSKYMNKYCYGVLAPGDACYVDKGTVTMRFVTYEVLILA